MDPDHTMNVMTTVSHNPSHDGRSEPIETWIFSSWVTMSRFMVNNRLPRGVTPWGTRDRKRTWPHFSKSRRCRFSRLWSPPNFLLKMNFSPESLPNCSCFELFLKNPKGCKPEVVQGSHKFISDVIKGSERSPTNSVFIGLFNQFTKDPVKDYVFQRMTKSILQELALCLLQEIISGGPERAASLNLVVEETKAGGKTVVVEKQPAEFPVDEDFVRDIDEAFFRITDLSGDSPDVKVASGQGHEVPYSPPDERG